MDVRLVAATNRDLPAMVREGTFREDLYYRLNVVNLRLPPLREHREDIPQLLEHFLKSAADDNGKAVSGITADAMAVLNSYDWPGNIRELRNCVERMVVLARGKLLTISDIPREIVDALAGAEAAAPAVTASSSAAGPATPPVLDIHANERTAIRQALEQAGGNRTKAAEILGISRRTLQRKLKQDPSLEEGAPPEVP